MRVIFAAAKKRSRHSDSLCDGTPMSRETASRLSRRMSRRTAAARLFWGASLAAAGVNPSEQISRHEFTLPERISGHEFTLPERISGHELHNVLDFLITS